jgi:hypothetical protein
MVKHTSYNARKEESLLLEENILNMDWELNPVPLAL